MCVFVAFHLIDVLRFGPACSDLCNATDEFHPVHIVNIVRMLSPESSAETYEFTIDDIHLITSSLYTVQLKKTSLLDGKLEAINVRLDSRVLQLWEE